MKNNINSFSAFGELRDNYLSLFDVIVRQHFVLYPNWKLHLLTDRPFTKSDYYGDAINKLTEEGMIKLTIVNNDNTLYTKPLSGIGMLWRLLPIWDDDNEYVFCRDLDSILTPRQLKYATAFTESSFGIHSIHDNRAHSGIMGGMCGFKVDFIKNKYSSFKNLIDSYNNDNNFWSNKNSDQLCLKNIFRSEGHNTLIHKQETKAHDRLSDHKNCINIIIKNVPHEVLNTGDNYCNYIGAVGLFCAGDNDPRNVTHKQVKSFYEQYINLEILNKLKEIEL